MQKHVCKDNYLGTKAYNISSNTNSDKTDAKTHYIACTPDGVVLAVCPQYQVKLNQMIS